MPALVGVRGMSLVARLHRVRHPLAPGIFRTEFGWRAFCRVDGVLYSHRFPATATIQQMQDWRARMRVTHRGAPARRAPGGLLGPDLDRYLQVVAGMPSWTSRRSDLQAWLEPLGGRDRDRSTIVRAEVAATLVRWQIAGTSPHTVNHRLTALHELYRQLDGAEAPDPTRGVKRLREPDTAPRGLPYRVVRAILRKVSRQGHAKKGEDRPPESLARVRLLVLAYTGIPPATLMRMTAPDVDLRKGTAWVPGRRKGAGTPGQVRPLTRQGVAAFRAFAKAHAWGPFSTSTVRRAFRRAVALVQAEHPSWRLEGVRPYDLRHAFGTAVFRATGDLHVTGGLLGHADARTTRRYASGAVLEVERRAVRKVERGL